MGGQIKTEELKAAFNKIVDTACGGKSEIGSTELKDIDVRWTSYYFDCKGVLFLFEHEIQRARGRTA